MPGQPEGPYAASRHPFYLLLITAQASIPLLMLSLWGAAVFLALAPGWLALIRLEERELARCWRARYMGYKRRTPIIPRPRRRRE